MRGRKFFLAASFTCLGLGAIPDGVTRITQVVQRLTETHGSLRFEVTESDLNQYLAHQLRTEPRPGVESLRLKLFAGNYVSAFSVVDFDAMSAWKSKLIPPALKPVLSGKKAIWVDIRFQVREGKATFQVEKAYYQNLRIPAVLAEKMIAVLAAGQPEKVDTTKPVPLPLGLKNLWVEANKAGGDR